MLKKLMMIILSVILASVSFSCRDNVLDGDTDDIDSDVENGADNDNPGSTNTKKLKTGDVAVFFTTKINENSEYFHEYDITIDSKTYAHLCLIPNTGKTLLVDTYRDVSYARANERCYTANGKLYIADNNSLSIKRFELNEYDLGTFKLRSYYADISDKINHDDFVLIGDKLFYHSDLEGDFFGNYTGGDMKVYDCTTRTTRKLLSYGEPLNYGNGTLCAHGDDLFCVALTSDGYLVVELRDQSTGTFLNYYKQYYFTDYNFYTDYEWLVALGDHSVFLLRGNSEKTELYRLTDTSIDFLLEVRSGGWPTTIDVDGSYVLLGFKNHLVIYNDDTNEVKKYEFDGSIIHPEILVVR
jgi:hypothetical protein